MNPITINDTMAAFRVVEDAVVWSRPERLAVQRIG
jgi:hypothetical protein